MLWLTKRQRKQQSPDESPHDESPHDAPAPTAGFLDNAGSRMVEQSTQVLYTDPDFEAPPPLNYSLRTRKKSLTIFWSLIFLDCICMPLALYFGLWYGTNLSHNAGEFLVRWGMRDKGLICGVGSVQYQHSSFRDSLDCRVFHSIPTVMEKGFHMSCYRCAAVVCELFLSR